MLRVGAVCLVVESITVATAVNAKTQLSRYADSKGRIGNHAGLNRAFALRLQLHRTATSSSLPGRSIKPEDHPTLCK